MLLFRLYHVRWEGTLASPGLASLALAGLALLSHSLCLANKVYCLLWPHLPPEADCQGGAIKVLKSSQESLLGLI